MSTTIPLDDYAREALREYVDATAQLDAATARRDKARQTLVEFFTSHDAEVGTVDDAPAVKMTTYDQTRIDTAALREREPYLARRFEYAITIRRLNVMRGGVR